MEKNRVLQVNLDGAGGAFTLLLQIQQEIYPEMIFDYYWMGEFVRNSNYSNLQLMKSKIYEENLRGNRLLGYFLLPFKFYKFLKKKKYHIIHINGDTAFKLLIYALPATMAQCPNIIIHSHSSGINGDYKRLKFLTHMICIPLLLKISNLQLTCSKKASKWMFPGHERQVIMLNNGVDINKFSFNFNLRKKYRSEIGITDNDILIGQVGNLSFQKYPEYAVDIIVQLDNRYKLIFIGDGPNGVNIKKYVADKGIDDRVIFYGMTTKVNEILNALDIFLMTSRFEGLPVSAVEAQTNGLPCVLSDKIAEETKLISNCWFVNNDKSVSEWVKIINNINQDIDRKAGRQRVKSAGFDIKDSAKLLLEIYRKCIGD